MSGDQELFYIWCSLFKRHTWFDLVYRILSSVFYARVIDSVFVTCCVWQVTLVAGKGSRTTPCRLVTRHLMTTVRTTASRQRLLRHTVHTDRHRPLLIRCLTHTPRRMPPQLLLLLLRQSQAPVSDVKMMILITEKYILGSCFCYFCSGIFRSTLP